MTSVALLLGMSALIGYNLGLHTDWLRKLGQKILDLFSGGVRSNDRNQNYPRNRRSVSTNRFHQPEPEPNYSGDDSRLSDRTVDSAFDSFYLSSSSDTEDLDDQLYEILAYNNSYSDFYDPPDDKLIKDRSFRNKTVDRIDQVLHQIDDIKKSIVEIDDGLYQASIYANFNPDIFVLTNPEEEEMDEASKQKTSEPSRKVGGRRLFRSTSHLSQKQPNDSDLMECNKSGYATSNSDGDSLQLEWDFEEDYDFYDNQTETNEMDKNRSASPARERLPSMSAAYEMPMTDEQKLKNMHDLLDEAKKLGLLNNILDALNPKVNKQPLLSTQPSESKELKVNLKSWTFMREPRIGTLWFIHRVNPEVPGRIRKLVIVGSSSAFRVSHWECSSPSFRSTQPNTNFEQCNPIDSRKCWL